MDLREQLEDVAQKVRKSKLEQAIAPEVLTQIRLLLLQQAGGGKFEYVLHKKDAKKLGLYDLYKALMKSQELRDKLSEQLDGVVVWLHKSFFWPSYWPNGLFFSWQYALSQVPEPYWFDDEEDDNAYPEGVV